MSADLNVLSAALTESLAEKVVSLEHRLGELTLTVAASDVLAVVLQLREDPALRFDQLTDLCGVDYSTYGSDLSDAGMYLQSEENRNPFSLRFAVVYQLLSLAHNLRLRLRIFAADDAMPVLPSVAEVWPCANWYEREAFDLYGIIFTGHPDLRRLLTDYGFVGNPFRKDFPLSGHVEMRYDAEQKRVIYQPVSIEPREVTPRIVREDNYAAH